MNESFFLTVSEERAGRVAVFASFALSILNADVLVSKLLFVFSGHSQGVGHGKQSPDDE